MSSGVLIKSLFLLCSNPTPLLIIISLFSTAFFFMFPLIISYKRRGEKSAAVTRRFPPAPKKLPIIGNLHLLLRGLPHWTLHRLSDEYGPLMFLQLGLVPTVVVSSADIAREIFKSHDLVFSGRAISYAAKKITYNCSAITTSPFNEYWKEARKMVVVNLLNPSRVQSFKAVREGQVLSMINNISANCSNSNDPINLSELMLSLVNRIVCSVAFGIKGGNGKDDVNSKSKFYDILQETQELLGAVNIADYFPFLWWLNKLNGLESRLAKNFRELDSFFETVIEEHLDHVPNGPKTDEPEDIVDVLLRLQNDPKLEISLANNHIKGILVDIFIAGTDTSSATIVWTMAELIRNPSAMQKAKEEVREAFKGSTAKRSMVDESDLSKLEYLKLVVKETLRLHPPAPLLVPRETVESCVISGYTIPAKTRVIFNATSIGRDPKHWEDPEEFKPERFLSSSVDFRGQNFELLPFGAGRRGCPGINFSITIVELVLANLLYRFEWTLPQGMKAEDCDMEEALGITMHKKNALCLVASSAAATI